jgi:hypothetical protein
MKPLSSAFLRHQLQLQPQPYQHHQPHHQHQQHALPVAPMTPPILTMTPYESTSIFS